MATGSPILRPASNPPSRPGTARPTPAPTNDHVVSFRHRLSLKEYPPDCAQPNVRWFYAVDIPKRTPFKRQESLSRPPKAPTKFVSFCARDSRAIETAFQKLVDEEDALDYHAYKRRSHIDSSVSDIGDIGLQRSDSTKLPASEDIKVPVNEDYLFDVDVKKRELAPAFWLGPVYEVRRGTWFYQEGSSLKPCDENLATQIEEGYLKVKPFQSISEDKRPGTPSDAAVNKSSESGHSTPRTGGTATPTPQMQQVWRLFGAHLNSFVVFVDKNTAWLLTDDFYGKLSATVWQRITAGTHLGGVKIVRGYSEPVADRKGDKEVVRASTPPPSERPMSELDPKYKRKSAPPPPTSAAEPDINAGRDSQELGRIALERRMSSYAGESEKLLEDEMEKDYAVEESDDPGREIEHLVLVTHGIGQRLSMRMESVNFVHDVNVLRKTVKSVYAASPDLQVLNGEADSGRKRKNCRVQCLPVCWRHLVDFPKQSLRKNRGEQDLSAAPSGFDFDEYPSLEDITVEGVPSVRNLMTDLALDVLLYQSATYREHIVLTVLSECNRIYRLFKARNPSFNGKVSFVGHSLGSAILFDILCRQPWGDTPARMKKLELQLDFPVENFFLLGSPVALFQMLKGHTVAARSVASPTGSYDVDEQFGVSSPGGLYPISSPKCGQLFNIFYASDPIAYRLEPLVSKAMAELQPQPLPYTKRGLFSANGQIVGGISGIGQSVSKSVSNMWSSLSSGIATSILNRSLGFSDSQAQASSKSSTGHKTQAVDPVEGQHPPTMIDSELETLYVGFQKRRKSTTPAGPELPVDESDPVQEAARLHNEEEKVRALNSTGRIDFAIQESVFDISLIASIASHLSYWADEDVSHFVISQMLSRQRVMKRQKRGTGRQLGSEWSIDALK